MLGEWEEIDSLQVPSRDVILHVLGLFLNLSGKSRKGRFIPSGCTNTVASLLKFTAKGNSDVPLCHYFNCISPSLHKNN